MPKLEVVSIPHHQLQPSSSPSMETGLPDRRLDILSPSCPNSSACAYRPSITVAAPRLHDLRHRFAVRTLIHWYRTGLDVERELPKLATYLGHVHVNESYWYLEAVPELLQLATERLIAREVHP